MSDYHLGVTLFLWVKSANGRLYKASDGPGPGPRARTPSLTWARAAGPSYNI